MSRRRNTQSYKDLLLTEIFPKMKKREDGSYDLDQVKDKLIPYLEPISVDQMNHDRVMRIIRNLCGDGDSARIVKLGPGFIETPGGGKIYIDPSRFVANNRGGIVPYMESRPEDQYDELARSKKNLDRVRAAWEIDDIRCGLVRVWQRKQRLQGRLPEQMIMTAFHEEYPLRKDDGEEGAVA